MHLPAGSEKSGASLDLPIAVALLVATGQICEDYLDYAYFGELTLGGRVLPSRGSLCHASHYAREAIQAVVSADDPDIPDSLGALGLASLSALRDDEPFRHVFRDATYTVDRASDYSDIIGHSVEKRVCQIAAAGNLGILFVGPAGLKSMLASRLTTIMPDMDDDEKLVAACTYSAARMNPASVLDGIRPVRMPHHSSTLAALVGGGRPVMPGEVALADGGVLCLADIQDFSPSALQHIRHAAVDGACNVVRADGVYSFPTRFLLAATAQPCPCGRFGSRSADCTCSATQIMAYRNRLCGPLSDCFQLKVDVSDEVSIRGIATSSSELRDGVLAARAFRSWRETHGDAHDTVPNLMAACRMDDSLASHLEQYSRHAALTGIGIVNVLKTARTIADIAQSKRVTNGHLAEALSYRQDA